MPSTYRAIVYLPISAQWPSLTSTRQQIVTMFQVLLAIDAALAGGLYLADYSAASCLLAAGAFWALLIAAFAFFVKVPVSFNIGLFTFFLLHHRHI